MDRLGALGFRLTVDVSEDDVMHSVGTIPDWLDQTGGLLIQGRGA